MSLPKVSVVVPVFNAQYTIVSSIQALLTQSYPGNIEVIMVDDGSTDRTSEIIQSFREVKYIRQENSGPAAARNKGAAASTGSYILFTDADCVAQPNWVDKIMKCFIEDNIGVVCGSYGIANPENMLARCVHAEILYRHDHLMPRYPRVFGSYNFGIRRKVFFEAGGFNEQYRRASGEDNDLSYKILDRGYRIYFARDALVKHFHPTRIKKYLLEQYRHGLWRVKMYKSHPRMARGDDYTFWKDMLEMPLALLFFTGLMIVFFQWHPFVLYFLFFVFIFLFFEMYFGFVFLKLFWDSFYFGCVMFLRSLARFLGLSTGISMLIVKKI